MSDHELELRQVFSLVYRNNLTLTAAINQVFGETRRSTFYSISEEERNAIADEIKAQVGQEIAEADAVFFQKREKLRAQIMEEALNAVLAGVQRARLIIDNPDSSDFNAIAAMKEAGDVLRNGIMIPDRKFTPELAPSPEQRESGTPLLNSPSMIPLPMPGTLDQVLELKVTSQDGTVLTVVRPPIVEQTP
jgi:hypothetical protein